MGNFQRRDKMVTEETEAAFLIFGAFGAAKC